MIEIVCLVNLLLLIFMYRYTKSDISSPSILYLAGFLVASFVCVCYKDLWDMDLHPHTIVLLVGGSCTFVLAEVLYRRNHTIDRPLIDVNFSESPLIKEWKLVFFIFFQLVSYVLYTRQMMIMSGSSDWLTSYAYQAFATKEDGEVLYFPAYVSYPYNISQSSLPIWSCLCAFFAFKKDVTFRYKVLLHVNCILAIIGSLTCGSRMLVLNGLIGLGVCYFLFYKIKNGWKYGFIPKKWVISIVVVSYLFGLFFNQLGSTIGRKESDSSAGYLFAVYCGAEIKNLDLFIRNPWNDNVYNLFGETTFFREYNEILPYFHMRKPIEPSLPFNEIKGEGLGNVYTNYQRLYHDFSLGALCFVFIMSYFMIWLYRKVMKTDFFSSGRLNYWIIFYIYLCYTTFMSFFHEMFFVRFTGRSLLTQFVWWVLIVYFLQGHLIYKKYK